MGVLLLGILNLCMVASMFDYQVFMILVALPVIIVFMYIQVHHRRKQKREKNISHAMRTMQRSMSRSRLQTLFLNKAEDDTVSKPVGRKDAIHPPGSVKSEKETGLGTDSQLSAMLTQKTARNTATSLASLTLPAISTVSRDRNH